MLLKPPSILHSVDSITVPVGRLIRSSALNMTTVEAPAICELSLDDHCRFFWKLYKRAAVSQRCFAAIIGTQHGTHVIKALP